MKILKILRYSLLYSLYFTVTTVSAVAQEHEAAQAEGLRIATEMKKQDEGWGDSQAELTMVLANNSGNESKLELTFKSLEMEDDGDKSLIAFTFPLDIKGTALLSFTHNLEADDKWLYLPALKRVKKVASQAKSGPFMGSEFAYEDLSSFEIEKYSYQYIGQDTLDNKPMYVVEFTPLDRFSGYARQKVWIDTELYILHKVEYYDRKNTLLKTENATEYHLYLDRYWRAHRIQITNHQTGKSTTLLTRSMSFNTGLTSSDFNRATLRRTR